MAIALVEEKKQRTTSVCARSLENKLPTLTLRATVTVCYTIKKNKAAIGRLFHFAHGKIIERLSSEELLVEVVVSVSSVAVFSVMVFGADSAVCEPSV